MAFPFSENYLHNNVIQDSHVIRAMRTVFLGNHSKERTDKLIHHMKHQEHWDQARVDARLKEIKILLRGIDARSIRPLRAVMAGTATKQDKEELKKLEEYAMDLRIEATEMVTRKLSLDDED